MDKNILIRIKDSIDSATYKEGADELDGNFIDASNFRSFKQELSSQKIVFVDGGNATLLDSPSYNVSVLRTACVFFSNNVRTSFNRSDFYSFTKSTGEFECTIFNKFNVSFDPKDPLLKQGNQAFEISNIGGLLRRLLELTAAKEACKELDPGSIIVLDGSLEITFPLESAYMESLKEVCNKKGILLTALSKTSRTVTDKGHALIEVLAKKCPQGLWSYELNGLYYLKLHQDSTHIFSLEIDSKGNINLEKLFGILAMNSKDALFRGYPYGLIIVDKLARISNIEAKQQRLELGSRIGIEGLEEALSALNAHSILDGQ